MQVKYIVYYANNSAIPKVDIWVTKGELTHPVYVRKKGIIPQNISSEGYLNFNPLTKKWALEHYQMDDAIPARNLMEFIRKKRIEKRDRLLVKRQIHHSPFLHNSQLQKETWEEYKKVKRTALRILFGFQKD